MAEKDQHHGHGGSYTRSAPEAARTLVQRTETAKPEKKQPAKKAKSGDGAAAADQSNGSTQK